jgi:uncharacterized protein (TIGR02117 family)
VRARYRQGVKPPRGPRSLWLRWPARVAGWLLFLVAAYFTAALLGALIPRSLGTAPSGDTVDIYVRWTPAHSELLLPVSTSAWDWRNHLPLDSLLIEGQSGAYPFIAISWGERGFFMNTPTWAEFDPRTGLTALAFSNDTVLHIYREALPRPAENLVRLRVSRADYLRLARSLVADRAGSSPQVWPGYSAEDIFVAANGRYSLLNTCNHWTARHLAAAGQRAPLWSPFAFGVGLQAAWGAP